MLASMRWGLVPAWFRENDPKKMQYSTSNCRSENMLSKKTYKVRAFFPPLFCSQCCCSKSVLTFCVLPEGSDDEGTALRHLS